MFLEVSATNDAARRLYDGAGFVEVGRRPRYYADGTDAVLMQRALTRDGAATG
jgi:ribosomal-protein-alanine N-acetyltransferase